MQDPRARRARHADSHSVSVSCRERLAQHLFCKDPLLRHVIDFRTCLHEKHEAFFMLALDLTCSRFLVLGAAVSR